MKARSKKRKDIGSCELGIDLASGKEKELCKWFLACLLFGKPVQQEVAKRTYFEFVNQGVLSPEEILNAGWDRLVRILDAGHYVRYDFSTATKLLDVSKELLSNYGSVRGLLQQSRNRGDLIARLQQFKGIGPVTARIFTKDFKEKRTWPGCAQ